MTKREEERRRRLLRRWKVPECTCEPEKSKDTMLDVLLKVASLSVIVVGFFSYLLHYLFAINAEQFYCVPSLYFYDRKLELVLVCIYILIPAVVLFIPVFVKIVSKESKFNLFERTLLALAVALLVRIESLHFSKYFSQDLMILFKIIDKKMSCINLARVTKIIQHINYDFLSLVLSVFSFLMYCFLFFLISRNNTNEQDEGCNSTKNTKLVMKITGFSYVFTGVLVAMMAVVLYAKVTPLDIKNQKSYEFISGKESSYRIIIEHYKDSVILMKGSTSVEPKKGSTSVEPKRGSTKECKETETQLIIIKDDYRIEPLGERQIEYRQFDKVGIDDKNKKK